MGMNLVNYASVPGVRTVPDPDPRTRAHLLPDTRGKYDPVKKLLKTVGVIPCPGPGHLSRPAGQLSPEQAFDVLLPYEAVTGLHSSAPRKG